MNIMFYLEPWEELKKPLFRLGSVRNHLQKEIKLLSQKNEVSLFTSRSIKNAIKDEGIDIDGTEYFLLNQSELKKIFPDYHSASLAWFNNSFSDIDEKKMINLVKSKLNDYTPDVILTYESSAPFLKKLFPDTLIINSMLGMFSREPFPELATLDPFGIYKNSFINNSLPSSISSSELDDLNIVRDTYKKSILDLTPFNRSMISSDFDSIALLPLQVSNYFAFSGNTPNSSIHTQEQLLFEVLDNLDPKIGLLVTEHGAENNIITSSNYDSLKKKYPNLIWMPELKDLRWGSQYILPFIDSVIAVSSSVALQAYFWNKTVISFGDCFLNLSSNSSFDWSEINDLIVSKHTSTSNSVLYFLLFKYYIPMKSKLHSSSWYSDFLEHSLYNFRKNNHSFDSSFFDFNLNSVDDLLDLRVRESENHLKEYSNKIKESNSSLSDIKLAIDSNDVISFDVFDTLITRNVFHHSHVFDLITDRAEKILFDNGIDVSLFGGFKKLRERSANRAIKFAKKNNSEEYSFIQMYKELRLITGISKDVEAELRKLELDTEKLVSTPRKLGHDMFDYCIEKNKTIILTSDMYLEKDFVIFLVKRAGFDMSKISKVYVSSDSKLLKKSGNLFKKLISDFPDFKILHIGDNQYSDFIMPRKFNINSIKIEQSFDIFKNNKQNKQLTKDVNISDSILHALSVNKFYDCPLINDRPRFNKDFYQLGYQAGGSIILGFTKWLIDVATKDNIDTLYFLARDGKIVKDVYNIIEKRTSIKLPKAIYLLGSRRSYTTPEITCESDIIDNLSLSFSEDSISNILINRFDLSINSSVKNKIRKVGFKNERVLINIKRDSHKNKFKELLLLLSKDIIKNSSQERKDLISYLTDNGLTDSSKNIGIVDIGHNGSLQKSLCNILDRKISGYYFATFHGAVSLAETQNVKGYLFDFEDNQTSYHPYCKNIGMFEFLFLPPEDTFIKFNKDKPLFVNLDETKRKASAVDLHRGIHDFSKDYLKVIDNDLSLIDFSSNRAIRTYIDFIKSPGRADASIFKGIFFVDLFGGRSKRFLISPLSPSLNNDFVKDSWWKEAALTFVDTNNKSDIIPSNAFVDKNMSSTKRKIRKLLNNPMQFFIDMKVFGK
jgi:predicted HAD superfamily hydrolase